MISLGILPRRGRLGLLGGRATGVPVAPDYAAAVQLADVQVSGVVTVRATVSSSGAVIEAAAQGNPFLTAPSLEAATVESLQPHEGPLPCVVELEFKYELPRPMRQPRPWYAVQVSMGYRGACEDTGSATTPRPVR
jgi:hypothetical protein